MYVNNSLMLALFGVFTVSIAYNIDQYNAAKENYKDLKTMSNLTVYFGHILDENKVELNDFDRMAILSIVDSQE